MKKKPTAVKLKRSFVIVVNNDLVAGLEIKPLKTVRSERKSMFHYRQTLDEALHFGSLDDATAFNRVLSFFGRHGTVMSNHDAAAMLAAQAKPSGA